MRTDRKSCVMIREFKQTTYTTGECTMHHFPRKSDGRHPRISIPLHPCFSSVPLF